MKSKLTKLEIFTLLMLFGIASCQKEEVKVNNSKSNVEILTLKHGGDDDEDPIVQGIVKNSQGDPVENAEVELFEQYGIFPIDSSTTLFEGLFEFQADSGRYFIMVTPEGQNPIVTDIFNLTEDIEMIIEI